MNNPEDDIGALLDIWNLSHLYIKFKEQKISTEVLKILSPAHINKLFDDLPVGDQAIFENNLNKWKKTHGIDEENLAATNLQTSQKTISVKEILNTTNTGKEILAFYKKNGKLFDEQRNLLITIITKYIEGNGFECTLSDCTQLEREICTIFETEEIDFYRTGKRGKIYNKLANLKRLARNVFKSAVPEHVEEENEHEENLEEAVISLRNDDISAAERDLFWRKSAPLRFKQLQNAETSTIFELWPEFSKPSAWQLIDIDFKLKYPIAKNVFEKWSQYGDKILDLMKQKISSSFVSKKLMEIDVQNDETKTFDILWYLHFIFPPSQKINTDPSGSKMRKKFSIADSQESFAIVAQTKEELETKIKLLQLQHSNIQPKLLIVKDFIQIKHISIYLDNIRYPFCNILNAFDILFKLFFVFNLKYPEESELFYHFIQTFLYEIPSEKKYSKIHTIRHELLK